MKNTSAYAVLTRFGIIAAVLATLVFIAPATSAQSASECTGSNPVKCTYDENGTDSVVTFQAEDEDTEDFTFALKAVDDHGSFAIGATSGVLSFKKPPNFEAKSSYKVTVTTSAGGEHKVEITINNLEETGKVSFTGNLQPQVGRSLRASVKDGDGGVYNELWQWSRSSDMETWTEIATARASLYTPGDDDVDHYLQARVTYRDALGSETETAMGMTEFKVEAEPAANRKPEFPDQNLEMPGVQNDVIVREVAENSGNGTSVGEPVAAFDRDPGDSLLYSLGSYPDSDAGTPGYQTATITAPDGTDYTSGEDDGDVFDINVTTGQITVKDKDELNFEAADNSFVVRVTATDPSGAAGYIDVVIKVTNADEKPVIGDVATGNDDTNAATNPDTSDAPIKIDEESTAITTEETSGGSPGAVRFTANSPDVDGDGAGGTEPTDVDNNDTAHADVKWSTAGPDGGKFKITVPAAGETNAGFAVLTFDKKPSFEAMGDADKNNIYEVDVVATYKEASDKKRVRIQIENIEETGKIDRMSQLQPVTGIPIVALGHSDGDGDIKNRSWSWYRGVAGAATTDERAIISGVGGSTGFLEGTDTPADDTDDLADCGADRVEASAATAPCKVASGSASYTPVDNDADYTLYAVVKYTDGHDDEVATTDVKEADEYVVLGSEHPSVVRAASNGRPAFIDQDTETAGIQNTETTREVDEGKKGKSAGDAVLATDPDSQPLLYSLGGADKGYFAIDRKSAEIKSDKDLDYESLPEDAKHYMVTVIATDPYGASASIAVTINVNDVNEDAKIVPAEQDSASECTGSKPVKCTYDENGTDPVARFEAEDEDTEDFTFALKAVDDHGSFAIGATSGVLSFKKPPNFEAKSSYKVTVTTSAGGEHAVEITINNLEETGKVSFTGNLQPQVGRSLRASVKDGDGGVYNELWQWSRSSDMETWTEIATARASLYTPGDDDVDHYLQARVTYRDALGSETETAMGMTEFKVEAEPAANRKPEFPDQNLEMPGVQNDVIVREVAENSGNGTSVGEPVAAFDRDPGDSLLYSLGSYPDSDAGTPGYQTATITAPDGTDYTSGEDDGDVFDINVTTGQITVKDKDELNFEAADNSFVVRVTATDPSGAAGYIDVVIKVTNADEKPVIGDVATGNDDTNAATNPDTSDAPIKIDEESTAITTEETSGGSPGAVRFTANSPDVDGDGAGGTEPTDVDNNDTAHADVKWSTAGPDGGKFKITVPAAGETNAGFAVLTFDKKPSFEAMGDADKNNIYEVDVVATYKEASDKKRVRIQIENIEETGKIDRMSQLQPVTGIPIVALGHSDGDGDIKNRSWSWYRGVAGAATTDERAIISGVGGSTGFLEGTDTPADDTDDLADCGADRVEASAATAPCKVASGSASYTPVDNDADYTLYAVVKYTDGHDDEVATTDVKEADEYVVLGSEHPSVVRAASNARPAFIDQDTATAGIQNTETTREVDEGKKGKSAGDAVLASDSDGQPLLYSLGGADKGYFAINRKSAEITSAKDLDYESLPEDAKHYMVTVIATDPYGASASIAVTINVNDVNEDAKIALAVAPEFDDSAAMTREVAENAAAGTNVGDPVMATDANKDTLTYGISGESDYFAIDSESGQITTKVSLDHEAMDSHEITVTASDGIFTAQVMVTINVTDVEEAPMFSAETAELSVAENSEAGTNVGDPVTASDGDGDELTYSLDEMGDMYFDIDAMGQITVGEGAMLDYETATSHSVTVTASDGELSDTIAVTIMVTDVDESPCVVNGAVESDGALAADCDTLLAIMDDLVGEDGTAELNWSNDLAIGEWDGVASGTGRVTGIYLRDAGLAGVLPAGIANLDALTRLTLTDNDLTGEIPDLDGLDSIQRLVLGGNAFTGSIPASLGNLDSLVRLWLHRNEGGFEGGIPAELGNLSNLRYLMLHGNGLTGEIPAELGMANNLKALYLYDNNLSGSIPAELGNLVSATDPEDTVRLLYLQNNMLTGDVPAELGNLVNLREKTETRTGGLRLSGNMLTGCIPAAIFPAAHDAEAAGLMACADDGNGNGNGES